MIAGPSSVGRYSKVLNPKTAVGIARDAGYEELFKRTSGWTGGDGTYSVLLGDGRTLWLFSDSLYGDVSGNKRDLWEVPEDGSGIKIVRNSVAIQSGETESVHFLSAGNGSARSIFEPPNGRGWFWVNGAVAVGETRAVVLLNQFDKATIESQIFGQHCGLYAATLGVGANEVRVEEYTSLSFDNNTLWGTSICTNPPWAYVFGAQGPEGATKKLVVARVPAEQLAQPEAWRFFDGKSWSRDFAKAQPIGDGATHEASIHRLENGDWAWVDFEPFGPIVLRTTTKLGTPWSAAKILFQPPERGNQVYSYGAKAHPHLSNDEGILISYSVNSLDLATAFFDADVFRPRFLRINRSSFSESFK